MVVLQVFGFAPLCWLRAVLPLLRTRPSGDMLAVRTAPRVVRANIMGTPKKILSPDESY